VSISSLKWHSPACISLSNFSRAAVLNQEGRFLAVTDRAESMHQVIKLAEPSALRKTDHGSSSISLKCASCRITTSRNWHVRIRHISCRFRMRPPTHDDKLREIQTINNRSDIFLFSTVRPFEPAPLTLSTSHPYIRTPAVVRDWDQRLFTCGPFTLVRACSNLAA
jgi:hypothetical protein